MLQSLKRSLVSRDVLDRVRGWVRRRFALEESAIVLVAEITCAVPGCPPRETVIAFWTDGDRRHQFKLFKPAAEVRQEDLPPAWLKNALIETGPAGCECC